MTKLSTFLLILSASSFAGPTADSLKVIGQIAASPVVLQKLGPSDAVTSIELTGENKFTVMTENCALLLSVRPVIKVIEKSCR
jgi:hypothetical protein